MRRVTPSLVVAVVALVLACSGGAVAAGLITGKQVKDSSLTGRDVKDRSLSPADFSGSVKGDPGPIGPTGPTGPQGPAGPAGIQGPPGPSTLSALTTTSGSMTIDAGVADGGYLPCPAGQRVVSGGFATDSGEVFLSAPTSDRSAWVVAVDNSAASGPAELDAYALCAGAGQAVAARAGGRRLRALSGRFAAIVRERRAAG